MAKENENKPKKSLALPPISSTTNIQEIIRKGLEIYNDLKEKSDPIYIGKQVVIEVDSGKYFIGDTRDEATIKAKKEFPDKVMFVKKIGQVEKVSRHFLCSRYNYARLF